MGSPINDPHPNDAVAEEVQEPEDFFGENGDGSEEHAESPEPDSPVEAAEVPEAATPELGEPIAEELEPEITESAPVEVDDETEPAAEVEVEESEEDEDGNKRQYVVLQEVVLDQDVLNELLKAVKGGVEPMTALIEVHRASSTNPKSALNGAWRRHKDEWVEPPRLAVVTANKIRTRKAKPRVREIIGYTFDE